MLINNICGLSYNQVNEVLMFMTFADRFKCGKYSFGKYQQIYWLIKATGGEKTD